MFSHDPEVVVLNASLFKLGVGCRVYIRLQPKLVKFGCYHDAIVLLSLAEQCVSSEAKGSVYLYT